MSSNLRVDRILPSTGTEVGVGTATGSVALYGDVNVAGTLTYEDVTSVDSVGLSTFQNGIHVTGGTVGIGTDNPGAKTHIDSTTSNTPLVVEASQNNRSRIVFRNNVETGTECNIELFDDDLRFVTNSGERLRIASNGKVGIDNTTPHRQLVVGDGGDISCFGLNGGIYFGTSTGGFRNNGAVARAQQAGYHVSTSQVGDLVMAPEADKALIFSSGSTNTMYERLRVTTGGQLLISGEAALTSTSLSHPLQVAAGSNADGIAIIGRASDDISELSFYEADKTTNLGEIQYRQDHVNFRHRVGHISFATGGVSERIRIKSNGVVQVANAAHGSDNGDRLLEVIGSGNSQAGFLIANNATSASGTCDITFAPSNKIAGAQIFCEAQEDFSTGVNRTADLTFITRKDGTLSEKVRITSSGITQQKDLSGNYHVIASSRDGSTSARAATSAWEIKKTLGPDAKTGYYYLTNPYDSTTQQWWCDMETDGGGWILVAYNGDGQMASNPGNWYDRNNKGGFNGLTQGFYRGGGYWNTWGDLKGQLMWECRTLDTYFNSSSCSKVGINWGKNNNLPTAGTRAYSNITGNANTLFENWCWDIYNAPGFEPSNYEQHARNNRIGGANYFTEHMVITWSFRGTSGSADDGSNGPYWMIGAHHDGLHQHYEESLSGGDGANGDGGYQVCSNEDTSWGGGGQQHSMNRLGRHNQDGGSVFVWMR